MSDPIRAEIEDTQSEHAWDGELSFKATILSGNEVVTTHTFTCGAGMTAKGRDYCVERTRKLAVQMHLEGRL